MSRLKAIPRTDVAFEEVDDYGTLCAVERAPSGSLTALVRLTGSLSVEGSIYSYDKLVRVRLHKEKDHSP